MSYILKTEKLTKTFKKQIAVNKLNITVNKGDIYGLVGRNGAGKTTFMKMIVGLLKPTSGKIELLGSNNLLKQRQKIGCVIEMPALYPNITAQQNLTIQSMLVGNDDQEEIKRILELVGLKEVGKKKLRTFLLV